MRARLSSSKNFGRLTFESSNQDQQTGQPMLVDVAVEKEAYLRQLETDMLLHHRTRLRYSHADEDVTLAVLPRRCLEELL